MGCRALTVAAAMLTTVLAADPAAAGIGPVGPNGQIAFETQVSVAANSFSWSLTGVPDIDQVRGADAATGKVGLPNNGKMWCLPTAGMNALAYLADFGYNTGVASKDWSLPENYSEMSTELADFGTEMGTDPVGGTGGSKLIEAMTARLEAAGTIAKSFEAPGVIQFVNYTEGGGWQGPSAQQMALAGLDGAVAFPMIGFYADEPDPDGVGIVKRRKGGHMMTGVGASGLLDSPAATATLRVRDPATLYAVNTVQTPYATDPHTVTDATYKFIWFDKDANVDKTGDRTRGQWDGSETTLWEGYLKIVPNSTWVSFGDKLKRFAYELVPPGPGPQLFDVPGKGAVSALALSAATPAPAYLVKGSSQVRSLNPVTGESTNLAKVKGAAELVFGGDSQRLFVAGARKLVALDGVSGEVLSSQRMKKPLAALAFDEGTDQLVGVTAGGGKLRLFDQNLSPRGARSIAGLGGKGEPLLAIGADGGLLLGKSGSSAVFSAKLKTPAGASATAARSRSLGLKRRFRLKDDIDGLVVDDQGRILVAQGGKLRVFNRKGRTLKSRFRGRASTVLAVTRSYSNADPLQQQPTVDFLPLPDPRP